MADEPCIDERTMPDYGYCGCCGEQLHWADFYKLWCRRCRGHVYPVVGVYVPTHERTYFAQHGRPCPYQV